MYEAFTVVNPAGHCGGSLKSSVLQHLLSGNYATETTVEIQQTKFAMITISISAALIALISEYLWWYRYMAIFQPIDFINLSIY